MKYWRRLVDRWTTSSERWRERVRESPVTVRLYAGITLVVLLLASISFSRALWFVTAAFAIVIAGSLLGRNTRGWGAAVFMSAASVVSGIIGVEDARLARVLYGILALGLLLAPSTLRWIKPPQVRHEAF